MKTPYLTQTVPSNTVPEVIGGRQWARNSVDLNDRSDDGCVHIGEGHTAAQVDDLAVLGEGVVDPRLVRQCDVEAVLGGVDVGVDLVVEVYHGVEPLDVVGVLGRNPLPERRQRRRDILDARNQRRS